MLVACFTISNGEKTWARNANSVPWRSCWEPRRSVPKPILRRLRCITCRPCRAPPETSRSLSWLTFGRPSLSPSSSRAQMVARVGTTKASLAATALAASSSIRVACSMERTPSSAQRLIALAGWQCAIT